MRKIYFLIAHFIFLSTSLHLEGKAKNNEYIPAEYVVIADKITLDVATKLSRRHRMSLFGTEGGLAGKVNSLGLSFQIKGPVEESRLREILIDCTEEFLHEININEKLRPHLKNYPFTNHEITISLFITATDGGWLHHPNIAIASSLIGILRYATFEEGNRFQFKSDIKEDYEEALRIVKGQKEQFSE